MKTKHGLWVPDREFHLPPPTRGEMAILPWFGALLEVGLWDRFGNILYQERVPSRSPLKQFLQILLLLTNPIGFNDPVKDTGGTNRTISYGSAYYNKLELSGGASSLYGIVIGTDATAVDILNNALIAQIVAGSGVGQMLYQTSVGSTAVTVADPDATFVWYRNFNNNSGGTITVRETGLYVRSVDGYGTGYFCIVRDTPTAVAVPDGGGCYVKYTLKITE